MQRRIGVHVSIAGGIDKGLERAKELGCTTVQIFSHNPRGWGLGNRQEEEIVRFMALKKSYDIAPVFIHTSYLINLATSRQELLRKSIAMVIEELNIADQIDAEFVVLHTGSAAGDDPGTARGRAIEALKQIAAAGTWKARLLLENTAGERGDVTSRIHDLAGILQQVPRGLIAGICLDTCHAFSAGYDICTAKGLDVLAREISAHCGRDALRLIHLNDAKKPLGSGVDRHEHIGEGMIGKKSFSRFVNHPFFSRIPLILETPKMTADDDLRNLGTVRALIGKG